MGKILLWLDDIRSPFEDDHKWLVFSPIPLHEVSEVVWVKTYDEFVNFITLKGLPDGICFDHDLSLIQVEADILRKILPEDEKTGYDCAQWLVQYCIDNNCRPPLWNVQSANPVGKDNINGLLNNYLKFTSRQ